MRAVFEDLGYTAKAIAEDQGIDTLDDVCFLKDGDVETLCKNVKCPGVQLGEQQRSQLLTPGQSKGSDEYKTGSLLFEIL